MTKTVTMSKQLFIPSDWPMLKSPNLKPRIVEKEGWLFSGIFHKGPFTNDVSVIYGIIDPLPP